jgi:ribosomal protein S18 acetylase RimI-like enzyme
MPDDLSAWRVRHNTDDSDVQALLERDRVWNCFALADLLPPFREHARFVTAARPGDAPAAALLIMEHPSFTAISPYGESSGVAAILAQTSLPHTALVQTTADHRAPLAAVYRPVPVWRPMLRMAVSAETFTARAASEPTSRLSKADLAEVKALLRLSADSPFRPELLEQDSFYGLRAHGRLVALAGTHVVAPAAGIAVVGNVFTHPDARGCGYAGMVTSAVVGDLVARGCREVVLNVFADNAPAIAVYDRLGFQTRHQLWSGPAALRQAASR